MEQENLQTLPHGYVLHGEKNRYVIDRVLGQGSFGITYLAKFKTTYRGSMGTGSGWLQVAVKEFFMRDMNTRDGSTGSLNDASQGSLIGKYRRAFVREAHNLANLNHPGIVNVFEVIETNNTVYIVMEYIDGGSLDGYISSRGSMPENEALSLFRGICSAVGFMHQHRMLHLDLKPKNIMLDEERHPLLIDFGLSKQYTEDGEPESSTSIGLGTPGYAPIEQAERTDNDTSFRPTIDIYALGGTLYKMLTGNTPPLASKVSESALEGDNLIAKTLTKQGISDATTALVTKAMWPSGKKRYQSVEELITAIDIIQKEIAIEEKTVIKPSLTSDPNSAFVPKTETVPVDNPTKGGKSGLRNYLIPITVGIIGFAVCIMLYGLLGKKKSQPTISVDSIQLDKKEISLNEGDYITLSVIVLPKNATDLTVEWESSDNNVIRVDNQGKLNAIKAGSATIIVTCGGKVDYSNVTVKPNPLTTLQSDNNTTNSVTNNTLTTAQSNIRVSGFENGHEWVDLGLSVKWATCNVGATNSEGYGDYYAWGEIVTKTDYSWSTYKHCEGSYNKLTKYCNNRAFGSNGYTDYGMTLDMSDDVAHIQWQGVWRMPTIAEFQELIDNCTWTWTTRNGVKGYKITGKKTGYNGQSVFLPAAGWRNNNGSYEVGSDGIYWSGTISAESPNNAKCLYFNSGDYRTNNGSRCYGPSIRPVCPK